jgi:hypothetical protein
VAGLGAFRGGALPCRGGSGVSHTGPGTEWNRSATGSWWHSPTAAGPGRAGCGYSEVACLSGLLMLLGLLWFRMRTQDRGSTVSKSESSIYQRHAPSH